MKNPFRDYRYLYWASSLVALVAVFRCFLLNQRLNDVKRAVIASQFLSRMPDPHEPSRHRDRNFEFVVRNCGFEDEGTSGDTIDDTVLLCGAWEKELAFFMRDYVERRGNKTAVFRPACSTVRKTSVVVRSAKERPFTEGQSTM
jgi:hypothetical protein